MFSVMKTFTIPPGLTDNIVGITHRPDIDDFGGIEFFVSFQEAAGQKYDDDRLSDIIKNKCYRMASVKKRRFSAKDYPSG